MGTTILTVSYTKQGKQLANRIASYVDKQGYTTIKLHKPEGTQWMGTYWQAVEQIIFVGAAGIAVRIAAPCLKDKMSDPGLIVVDEKGRFFIPILSGHVGGANAFAVWLSKAFEGTPVVTTGTDVNGSFAVDSFAKGQGLMITERQKIKMISSAILNGEIIGFYSGYPITGKIPKELCLCKEETQLNGYKYNIIVTDTPKRYEERANTICLCPQNLILGIGCKRGTDFEQLKSFVQSVLLQLEAEPCQIFKIASIDLKSTEKGLIALANDLGVQFVTQPKEVLEQIETVSEESEFVKQVTGIGNVCERAALYECKEGRMILPKFAKDGMTIAVMAKDRGVYFE